MPLHKIAVIAAADTLLPRDGTVNDLYFTSLAGVGDYDGLALDACNVFKNFWYRAGQIRAKIYDVAADGSTGAPKGEAVVNEGSPIGLDMPAEVALCLSFWAGNRSDPHRRGRIYLQMGSSAFGPAGKRPSAAHMTAALNLGDEIVGLGGADISWQVYSQTLRSSEDVTNTWCDDEWDTIRSRGLRATTSQTRGV